jgi:murein DD-endopeptidase MepM/ murein hydrolase activator NlpD
MLIPKRGIITAILFSCIFCITGFDYLLAQEKDVSALQDQINARKSQIDQINSQIEQYREKVNQYASEAASLENDIAMIENQTKLTELDIEATQIEIESQELHIQKLESEIDNNEAKIEMQKNILREMLFELNKNDGVSLLEVVFTSNDVNSLFSEIEYLETINNDISKTVDETKQTKQKLVEDRADQQGRLDSLIDLQDELTVQMATLDSQMQAKDTLLDYTEQSESQYKVLLSEMRQEQQYITQQILSLQDQIDQTLLSGGESGSETYFLWPMQGVITATFHDPTYPFRHLFEHTGLDIATTSGTPITAAAPGYVAWARYGNSYGNYVMIIHANGYATLYAHMSSIAVVADQYVSRGQVVGYEGTTGFSTGPHLHFEIRKDGIPVDPQLYLLD